MAWLGAAVAVAMMGIVLIDSFEAMILPRRVRHKYRLGSLFYRSSWSLWKSLALMFPVGRWRFGFFSVFGPLSLFGLMGVWAVGLIASFALLHWSLSTPISFPSSADDSFQTYLYFSGTTFFTLGYGDIVPASSFARALSVIEAGLGFGFLAVVISYLPVLYQAFSRREVTISLLDARAGSPPSASELLRRFAEARSLDKVGPLLVEWERWAAELLESHLSFPVLRYYRSQHDNQSWVAALTMILDTSAILIACDEGHQARLTFAMARHAAVDLVLVSRTMPEPPTQDRLPEAHLAHFLEFLQKAGLGIRSEQKAVKSLTELRGLYEPFVNALATHLEYRLPPFLVAKPPVDNWQTSPGMRQAPRLGDLQAEAAEAEHLR